MEAAVHLISKIPGDVLRIVCLLILTSVFFIPLLLIKKNKKDENPSNHEILRDAKMMLEIKKLSLELDEKQSVNIGKNSATDIKRKDEVSYLEPAHQPFIDQYSDELAYLQRIKLGMSGSVFFFLITTVAFLGAEHNMDSFNDYMATLARDMAICIASGFSATFVPWGGPWHYFVYGFIIPIIIALIIVIIT